jgi:hypothetical protein
MQFDIALYLGWTQLGRQEIPDDEIEALWNEHQQVYATSVYGQQHQGQPDYSEFLHELVYQRFEAPVLERLRNVEGVYGLDWADDALCDVDGNTL